MCGLGAIVQLRANPQLLAQQLKALEQSQKHRGPDGQATRIEPVAGASKCLLGLAHQRLAVVDLTERANQPMNSVCGRYVLCYNGEIYNYKELAQALHDDGDTSLPPDAGDTAVLLACLIRWGTQALQKINGMWAFVLYDKVTATLLVSRDRMGVKPLYWSLDADGLVIASEVKGILAATGKRYPIHEDVVARHLVQSLANTDTQTMFRGIESVPAASFAILHLHPSGGRLAAPVFTSYWQHPFELQIPLEEESDPEYLCFLLQDAVRIRLRSDVPCGLLLSGGLDSSAILASAHAQQLDLQVLSATSRDPASSEEYWVKQMARQCGIKPIWVQIDDDPLSLLSDLGQASHFNDAPLPGLAMIAQQRLMLAAKEKGMVVVLSGQGADEQLGGYNKFFYFYLRELVGQGHWSQALAQAWSCFARGTVLNEFSLSEAKRYLPTFDFRRTSILGARLNQAQLCDTVSGSGYREREWRDLQSLSIPLLLHCEDRMSMSWGRETRHPFMDYRIVDFLATVPARQKFKGGWPKWLLREAMRHDLPTSISWRRDKKGFNIPEALWLRTVYAPYVQQLLAGPLMCVDQGLVNLPALKFAYQRFLAGVAGASYKDVLSVITLEAWMREYSAHLASP